MNSGQLVLKTVLEEKGKLSYTALHRDLRVSALSTDGRGLISKMAEINGVLA